MFPLIPQTITLQIIQRLSSTNFTRSILEYYVPYIAILPWKIDYYVKFTSPDIKSLNDKISVI